METTNRRLAQLTLLSQLGQGLNAASDLDGLCTSISRILLEHSDACGVIIRPRQYGNPPPQSYYCTIESVDPALKIFFLQQESQLSGKTLHKGRSQLHFPLSNAPDRQLPASIFSLPLKVHDRIFGTLSLLGGSPQAGLPFTPDQQELFLSCGFQIAQTMEQLVTMARLRQVSASDFQRLQDLSLLYRITQLLHSTLATNELFHLILSLLVSPDGGGFHRAMLFMVNRRGGTLQGILGMTQESASWLLPDGLPPVNAPAFPIPADVQKAQRNAPFSREVMQQRLLIEDSDSCLARVAREQKAVLVSQHPGDGHSDDHLCRQMQMGDHACVPLISRGKTLCVLAVDNATSPNPIDGDRLRFLEMFAGQAGIALDNAQLLQRIETAHNNLREAQDQLLQKEKLATVGEMSASIAHELKNPLVSVGGFARRLTRSLEPESPSHQYASVILQESERLEAMLDDILAFSKQRLLCIRGYQLDAVLDRALFLEGELLQRAGIYLKLEKAEGLPQLQGDAGQLEQVFINLISNARQAMPEGGELQINIRHCLLRGEPAIRVEISDTGGGIPAQQMRNIFNPFFTTKEAGTGLGLPISHRIIEHHQGEIAVINTDHGACFSVTLPVQLRRLSADPLGYRQPGPATPADERAQK